MVKFVAGDRVAFSHRFCRAISADHYTASRRGEFLKPYPGMEKTHCLIRWDDQEARIASRLGQYAEQDYCDCVREQGELCATGNLAKVGSLAFSD